MANSNVISIDSSAPEDRSCDIATRLDSVMAIADLIETIHGLSISGNDSLVENLCRPTIRNAMFCVRQFASEAKELCNEQYRWERAAGLRQSDQQ
jgi:hypothetical protein